MKNPEVKSSESGLTYPFTDAPSYGSIKAVGPGVYWLQMPLPMSLNHINLYLIEEDTGWVVIDTGIRGSETSDWWLKIFDHALGGKPVNRIICTHMHPDHTGQAGFISEHFKAPLYMSYGEYYQARIMGSMMRDGGNWQMSEYYQRAGFSEAFMTSIREARSSFTPTAEDKPLPSAFIRLSEGDEIKLGDHNWQIMTGTGHSPEHVCLYCPELKLFISGDQILPVITSNVSVYPTEPEANPMLGWLASHEDFMARLPDDILVLPAHNMPFYGVQARLQALIDHHEDRMLALEENCLEATSAIDLLPHLFSRKLEGMTKVMALGECVAHLHLLMSRGRIKRLLKDDIYLYQSIDPKLNERSADGQHEDKDEQPIMV